MIPGQMYGLTDLSQKQEITDARTIDRKQTKQANGDLLTTTTTTRSTHAYRRL